MFNFMFHLQGPYKFEGKRRVWVERIFKFGNPIVFMRKIQLLLADFQVYEKVT